MPTRRKLKRRKAPSPPPEPKRRGPHPGAAPPDIDTIGRWARDTVGEAACPHGCFVEHDGFCPHGHPSWVSVVLGV